MDSLARSSAHMSSGLVLLSVILLSCCSDGDGGGSASPPPAPPTAIAGQNVNALLNELVVLDGSASTDPTGKPLTYQWTIISKPTSSSATLFGPTTVSPTFTTDVTGPYVISLVVSNGMANSSPSTVTVTALSSLSKVHDTGQVVCYNASAQTPCPSSSAAFYGQDAQYYSNPLRFTDNGSTISDAITGLTWQKADDGVLYNWYQAIGIFDATYNPGSVNVCGTLALGGLSGWRLPSRRELSSILNYASEFADRSYFQSSGSDYWTSTTSAVGTTVAWGVVNGARVTYGFGSKGTSALYVRCAHGAPWGQNNFVDNGDGTVTDATTSLRWQQADDGVARNWQDALSYCQNLTLVGLPNWRLPDIKELETLVYIDSLDVTPYLPATYTTLFPSTKSDYYWSSTTRASTPGYAWYVDFSLGWVDWGGVPKTSFKFVRCVH